MKKALPLIGAVILCLSLCACSITIPSGAHFSGTATEAPKSTKESSSIPTQSETGIRTDFKTAMDAYEAFYAEYCDLMNQYYANPTDFSLLSKYTEMLTKASEMEAAFAAWESEDLSSEELQYYVEVNARVLQMLADITYGG